MRLKVRDREGEQKTQAVTITIDRRPEIERGLLAPAQALGVALVYFAQEVLARGSDDQSAGAKPGVQRQKFL